MPSADPLLTVAICAHNPRLDYLQAVLDGLRAQTLPLQRWELLIVDNQSEPAIAVDLSWHPQARIVCEMENGILPARLRAIHEAKGKLLCFFDDDNVPCADYLEAALEIGAHYTWLGAWGAAEIVGKFEVPPEPWSKPFLHMLALRSEKGDHWSNMDDWRSIPYTAGMIFRRAVGQEFVKWVEEHRSSRLLGRKADSLLSHEDIALAHMAFQLKLGTGIFERLRIEHLIPKKRLEFDYLRRLSEAFGYSGVLSKWVSGQPYRPARRGKLNGVIDFIRLQQKPWQHRECTRAARRGERNALQFIRQQAASSAP